VVSLKERMVNNLMVIWSGIGANRCEHLDDWNGFFREVGREFKGTNPYVVDHFFWNL